MNLPQVIEPSQLKDFQLEKSVLAGLINYGHLMSLGVQVIQSPEMFGFAENQIVWQAMTQIHESGNKVDQIMVCSELNKMGVRDLLPDGLLYVSEITNYVYPEDRLEGYLGYLLSLYQHRLLIFHSDEISKKSKESGNSSQDVIQFAENGFYEILKLSILNEIEGMDTLVAKSILEIERAAKNENGLIGVPSGFVELDRKTSGFCSGNLIILAARPGMGKTSLALCFAKNAALDFEKPVAIFSLEMTKIELTKKLMSIHSGIPNQKIRTGSIEKHEWDLLMSASDALTNAKIHIDDTPGISIQELRSKALKLKHTENIQMIVVDYLQLMQDRSVKGNREQEISSISRKLKELAKELEIPVIALSQLSRAVETRGGAKRPMLSDLRESGAIEQDADMVAFIYRPEYYNFTEDEEGLSLKGIAEVILAKNRHGGPSTTKLRFQGETASFLELESNELDNFSMTQRRGFQDEEMPF